MIEQWFAAVHDALDDLIRRYPLADAQERARLQEQWNVVKSLSDRIVEQWLLLEDKLALFQDVEKNGVQTGAPELRMAPYIKGQGYFKLHMFRQAATCFEETVRLFPDLIVARLFLAMARMHLAEFGEAQRHFQLIAALAEEPKLQAISYNALGCIQAASAHLEQARRYFERALEADPTFVEPKRNLECCRNGKGRLQLQFGSAELQALVEA